MSLEKKPKSILCATDVAARGINIEDIKFVINVDYPVQTEDYIHRIGRTARSTNVGTAYTFITSDNSRHLPKLIEVLKESNQQVSDSVMNLLARTGGRMNNRNFSRGGYQNNANNNNSHYAMANGNGAPRTNYQQQSSFNNNRDYSNGQSAVPRKRDLESDSHDSQRSNGDGTRVKKFRWDDGPAPNRQSPPSSRSYANGSSAPNNMSYGPYPPQNGSASAAAPGQIPLPPKANGVADQAYPPADYNSMYNIQYYQAIAAAAANNGGAGWQAAAAYPNWPQAASTAK